MAKAKPDPKALAKAVEKAKKDRIKALSLSFSDARAAVSTIAAHCKKGTLPGDDLATRKSILNGFK